MDEAEKILKQNKLSENQTFIMDAIEILKKCKNDEDVEFFIKRLNRHVDRIDEKINELF